MEPPSTRSLASLPAPERLQHVCKAMAALDAVLQGDDRRCYHSYFPEWGDGIQIAKVDNGAGDDLFCVFSSVGTIVKGFDHESPLSPHAQEHYQVWPGVYDGLPTPLSVLLDDPAFERDDVTFCLWQTAAGKTWDMGTVQLPPGGDDGSSFLLGTLFLRAKDYVDWAQEYYEVAVALEPVQRVYDHLTLNEDTARYINPQTDYEAVRQEIQSILG